MKTLAKNTAAANENPLKQRWNNAIDYFRGVYSELKKVHWSDRRQLVAYTGVVLFAVTLMAVILWLFDTGLSYLLTLLLNAFG